jgi:hypothetical protein
MRRSTFYQPLEVFMALLMAPPFSWLGGLGSVSSGSGRTRSAAPFRAAASSFLPSCNEDTSILKPGCEINPAGLSDIVRDRSGNTDLLQFESDAVQAYLALHMLPASDAGLIYNSGRPDLRIVIRGIMFAALLAIISKPAADRTPHEQAIFSWFHLFMSEDLQVLVSRPQSRRAP